MDRLPLIYQALEAGLVQESADILRRSIFRRMFLTHLRVLQLFLVRLHDALELTVHLDSFDALEGLAEVL